MESQRKSGRNPVARMESPAQAELRCRGPQPLDLAGSVVTARFKSLRTRMSRSTRLRNAGDDSSEWRPTPGIYVFHRIDMLRSAPCYAPAPLRTTLCTMCTAPLANAPTSQSSQMSCERMAGAAKRDVAKAGELIDRTS